MFHKMAATKVCPISLLLAEQRCGPWGIQSDRLMLSLEIRCRYITEKIHQEENMAAGTVTDKFIMCAGSQ